MAALLGTSISFTRGAPSALVVPISCSGRSCRGKVSVQSFEPSAPKAQAATKRGGHGRPQHGKASAHVIYGTASFSITTSSAKVSVPLESAGRALEQRLRPGQSTHAWVVMTTATGSYAYPVGIGRAPAPAPHKAHHGKPSTTRRAE